MEKYIIIGAAALSLAAVVTFISYSLDDTTFEMQENWTDSQNPATRSWSRWDSSVGYLSSNPSLTGDPDFAQKEKSLHLKDDEGLLDALEWFRKSLVKGGDESIVDNIVRSKLLGRLSEILGSSRPEKIRIEAAWILANIAAKIKNIETHLTPNDLTCLSKHLFHKNLELRGQCIRAIGNIAAESPKCRSFFLDEEAPRYLAATLKDELDYGCENGSLAKDTAWAIANLCSGKPSPPWYTIEVVLPVLAQSLLSDRTELHEDAFRAIVPMTESPNYTTIKAILGENVLEGCNKLLPSLVNSREHACLDIVGNILARNEQIVKEAINSGALQILEKLLTSRSRRVVCGACLIISDVIVRIPDQLHPVIQSNLLASVIRLLSSQHTSVKGHARSVISFATSVGDQAVIDYLVATMCQNISDPKESKEAVKVLQEELRSIIKAVESSDRLTNCYDELLREAGCLESTEPSPDLHSTGQGSTEAMADQSTSLDSLQQSSDVQTDAYATSQNLTDGMTHEQPLNHRTDNQTPTEDQTETPTTDGGGQIITAVIGEEMDQSPTDSENFVSFSSSSEEELE